MSILLLQVDGAPYVAAVNAMALDAGEDPLVLGEYVASVREHVIDRDLSHEPTLRYCLIDVHSVAEYGPDDIAALLTDAGREAHGSPDLPQAWETLT
jgi:hypothetical protein